MSPRPLVLVMALCACSGNVDTSTSGGGGSGGDTAVSGGSGAAAGSGEAGGSSGSGILVGGGGAGGATATTGGGGSGSGGGCSGSSGYVQLDVDGDDDGPPLDLDWTCMNAPAVAGASAALGYTGKGGPLSLFLSACSQPDNQGQSKESLSFRADLSDVGSTTSGHAELSLDGPGQVSATDDIFITVTEFGPVGGTISGDLDFTIVDAIGKPMPIHGVFAVCRYPDYPAPP